jgi:hypothetical protein
MSKAATHPSGSLATAPKMTLAQAAEALERNRAEHRRRPKLLGRSLIGFADAM